MPPCASLLGTGSSFVEQLRSCKTAEPSLSYRTTGPLVGTCRDEISEGAFATIARLTFSSDGSFRPRFVFSPHKNEKKLTQLTAAEVEKEKYLHSLTPQLERWRARVTAMTHVLEEFLAQRAFIELHDEV